MRREMDDKDEEQGLAFKNLVFAHDVVPNNPGIFFDLYPQDAGLSEDEESELDWDIPQTVGEAEAMLAELRRIEFG